MSGIGSGLSPGINAPSGSLGAMTVSFGADFSGFNDAVSQMGSSLNQLTDGISGIFGGAIGMVTGLVTGLGEAMIGVGAQSLSMAGDFQQQTNLLITSAGETVANIGMIRDGLLSMSVDTATGTANLVKGMFNIESAGYHGAAALLIEKTAAEGAKVENADLAATTDVLSTAMHNYSLPVMQATDVMNSFRMSASMGKMHMDDLTAAMKNVLPIASQAGVALTGVEAALSTMSLSGDKGASAGTHLSQMLTYLLAPSSKATKALQSVGLTTQEISDEMKQSLPGAVEMITKAVGEQFPAGSARYLATISAIVGGNKSMKAMLELSGQSLSDFIKNADQLAPTMTANSTAVDGWNIVQGNFNTQMESANNAIDAVFISIGQYLLPIVTQLLAGVAPLIDDLAQWIEHSQMLADASKNLTDYLGNLGQGFHDVFDPVKQVTELWPTLQSEVTGLAQTSLPPLTDALDRVTLGMKPMSDALDRATGSLKFVSHAFDPLTDGVNRTTTALMGQAPIWAPMTDAWDRANKVVAPMGDALDRTAGAWKTTGNAAAQATTPIQSFWQNIHTVWENITHIDWGQVGGYFTQIGQNIKNIDWSKVGAFFTGLETDVKNTNWAAVGKFFTDTGTAISKVDWGKVGSDFSEIVQAFLKVDWAATGASISQITTAFGQTDWKSVATGVSDVFNAVVDVGTALSDAYYWASSLNNLLISIMSGGIGVGNALHNLHVPGFAGGVQNFEGGLAYVHKDELVYLPQGSNVYPVSQTKNMLSGGSGVYGNSPSGGYGGGQILEIHTHIHWNGTEIGEQVSQYQMQQLRLRQGVRSAA